LKRTGREEQPPRRPSLIVALASPGIASTLDEGLDRIKRLLSEASAQGAEIVCFPEAYLPGLPGQDFACRGGSLVA
jgi:predicted amidohydrolase